MAQVNIDFNVRDGGAPAKIQNITGAINRATNATTAGANAFSTMFGSILAGNLVTQVVTKTLTAMKQAVLDCVEAAMRQQKVEAQLEAVLKSTNNAIGMSKDQLVEMAKGLQAVTTYGDDAVIGAENLLLTFTNIGRDVFPDALETVLDMSTALGQDLKSSAIQLGKALQDPILGVTALRRVGVNFNQAQTDVIKKLVETGRALEAQKMILKELSTEFGGSARTAANNFAGRIEQIKNQISDLKEAFGNFIVQNESLALALEGVVAGLKNMTKYLSDQQGGLLGIIMKLNPQITHLILLLQKEALEERARQKRVAEGKKRAEEFVAALSKEGATLNVLGVDLVAVTKKLLGLGKGTEDTQKAIMSLAQIQEKYKIQTKDELTAALREAEVALDIYSKSADRTAEGVKTLTETVEKLKEAISGKGKKEYTIFDMVEDIMKQRKGKKPLEPIPLYEQLGITEIPRRLQYLGEQTTKAIEDWLYPPPKLKLDWAAVASDISRYWQDGIADMIAGTSSFRDFVANSFRTLAAGAGSAIGQLAGNALKGLGAIAGPLGSAIGGIATAAITGLGKLFGIKSKAEKEREAALKAQKELEAATGRVIAKYRQLGDVSESTAKSIAEATKTMGGARAEAKYFDQILRDVGIRADNISQLWYKATTILQQTRRGTVPAREGIESLNEAFDQLISGAQKLGKEYSLDVARFVLNVKDSGLQVGSVTEYVREQLSAIPAAFTKMINGARLTADRIADMGKIARYSFDAMIGSGMGWLEAVSEMREGLNALKAQYEQLGGESDHTLNKLFRIADITEQNQDLFEAISANQKIIESLGNSGWLTNDAMAALSRNAYDFYKKLGDSGLTADESLRAMGPTLQRLYEYAKAYGLQVDENTQGLIDQAKTLGIVKDAEDAQAAAMRRVFDDFGDRMEDIMDRFGDRLARTIGGVGYDHSGEPMMGYQSGGIAWTPQVARVAEKEPEAIIPLSKIREATAASGFNRSGFGPLIFNLQLNGKTIARLIAPDLQRLQERGRFRTDISTLIRNET